MFISFDAGSVGEGCGVVSAQMSSIVFYSAQAVLVARSTVRGYIGS